jgi:ABC-2 type transport system permease protein
MSDWRKHWHVFAAMAQQQSRLLWRYPVNMLANLTLAWVGMLLVALFVALFSGPATVTTARSLILYGFIFFLFLNDALWSVGFGLLNEQTTGTLTGLYLAPQARCSYMLARILVALSWTGLAGGLGFGLVYVLVGPISWHGVGLTLLILLCAVSMMVGLGLALAGLGLRFGPSIEVAVNLLQFSLIGLCAFFYPFAALSPTVQTLARLIPLSYSVDAFRTIALGWSQPELLPLTLELPLVLICALIAPWLGWRVYLWCEIAARREGRV